MLLSYHSHERRGAARKGLFACGSKVQYCCERSLLSYRIEQPSALKGMSMSILIIALAILGGSLLLCSVLMCLCQISARADRGTGRDERLAGAPLSRHHTAGP